MDIQPGDVVRLRKKHPCGSDEWQVIQTGADIRIKCLGCQRYILVDRFVLERKIKVFVSRSSSAGGSEPPEPPE
jgi:hypothetical protein